MHAAAATGPCPEAAAAFFTAGNSQSGALPHAGGRRHQLSPIVAQINILLGIGVYHKNDEMKYRPFRRRERSKAA